MLKLINIREFGVQLKASIQATGRLGFTTETEKMLCLDDNTYVKFASDDQVADSLYMVVTKTKDENSMKVNKSGSSLYLPTKLMFDSMGIEYKKRKVMFDLVRMERYDSEMEGKVYKMNKRVTERKEAKE